MKIGIETFLVPPPRWPRRTARHSLPHCPLGPIALASSWRNPVWRHDDGSFAEW